MTVTGEARGELLSLPSAVSRHFRRHVALMARAPRRSSAAQLTRTPETWSLRREGYWLLYDIDEAAARVTVWAVGGWIRSGAPRGP